MKYTIHGFRQKILLSYGLDCIDALILRWIVDSYHMDKIKKIRIEDKDFFQIDHESLYEDLPILGTEDESAIAGRLNKFVDLGLLEKHMEQEGDKSVTYFAINKDEYQVLLPILKCKLKGDRRLRS